jgi:hypothetical protein
MTGGFFDRERCEVREGRSLMSRLATHDTRIYKTYPLEIQEWAVATTAVIGGII